MLLVGQDWSREPSAATTSGVRGARGGGACALVGRSVSHVARSERWPADDKRPRGRAHTYLGDLTPSKTTPGGPVGPTCQSPPRPTHQTQHLNYATGAKRAQSKRRALLAGQRRGMCYLSVVCALTIQLQSWSTCGTKLQAQNPHRLVVQKTEPLGRTSGPITTLKRALDPKHLTGYMFLRS